MELIAKLSTILETISGTSQSTQREWVRGGFVVETEESFPRKVAFTLFGQDKVDALNGLAVGSYVRVIFHLESREYQGRWYTDARCESVTPYTGQPMPGYGQPMPGYAQPTPGYSQPMPGYGQPMPSYGQPTPGYGQPVAPAVNTPQAPGMPQGGEGQPYTPAQPQQPVQQTPQPSMPQNDDDLPF